MITAGLMATLTHFRVMPLFTIGMVASIRVLIACGQAPYRARLAKVLRSEPDLSVTANSSLDPEVLGKTPEHKPDVILVDVQTPGCVEAASRAKEELPEAAVLVLSESGMEEDVLLALESGAEGCILKNSAPADVVQAVRKAAGGEVVLPPGVAAALMKRLRGREREARLSERELEVLELLGTGLTNREIAARLVVTESTAKTYVQRLREKLHFKNRLQLGLYAASRRQRARGAPNEPAAMGLASALVKERGAVSEASDEAAVRDAAHAGGTRKPATAVSIQFRCHGDALGPPHPGMADELIRECMQLAGDEVYLHEGTVVSFSTNGMMAFFGLPVSREHAPQQALHAALAVQKRIGEHAQQQGEASAVIECRIGVCCGTVLVAGGTDEASPRYIPEKDMTELAVRVRDAVDAGMIGVCESARRLTTQKFAFEPQGEVWVNEPVGIYRLVGPKPETGHPPAEPVSNMTDFVGRAEEVADLRRAYSKARSGSGQAVGVVGEAGVGKSRLLHEFRKGLAGEDFAYLEGSCIHYGESIAYLPFLRMLRTYFDLAEGDPESAASARMKARAGELGEAWEQVLPPLQDILSLKVEDEAYVSLDPAKRRERIFEAIRHVLLAQSRSRNVVLAIEDLHWIDRTSEELLSYLIDGLDAARVLLVMLYRPEYHHQWSNRSSYTQVRLNELSSDNGASLVKAILSDAAVAPEVPRMVVDRAGGNPLFIEELVQNLLERGVIQRTDHEYRLDSRSPRREVPDSIRGIIAARLDRLDDKARRVLQAAAVIGRDFSYDILGKTEAAKDSLERCLSALLRAELIYGRSASPGLEYVFKHALIQEVAYDSLPLKDRRQIHREVAQALEERHRDTPEEVCEVLAHHYSNCGDQEKACRYLRLSGDKAARACSNQEAIRLYRDAIAALLKEDASRASRAQELEIRLAMDGSLRGFDYPDGSLENLEEAQRLAVNLGDESARITVLGRVGWYHMARGEALLGLRETEEAFKAAAGREEPDLAIPVALNLIQALQATSDWKSTERATSETVWLLERTHTESKYYGGWANENIYCAVLGFRGCSLEHLGRFDEAQVAMRKALSYARQIDHPTSIGFALHLYAGAYWVRGDGRAAAKYLREAIPIAERVGNSMLLASSLSTLGIACLLQRDYGVALEYTDKGLKAYQRVSGNVYVAHYFWAEGWVRLDMGRIEEARQALEEGLRLALLTNDRMAEGINRVYLGRALFKEPESAPSEAEQSIKHGIQVLEDLELRPWYAQGYLFLGELYATTGQKEEAQLQLKKAEDLFRGMKMDYWSRRTQDVRQLLENPRR